MPSNTYQFSDNGTPAAIKTAITQASTVPQKVRVAMQEICDLAEQQTKPPVTNMTIACSGVLGASGSIQWQFN